MLHIMESLDCPGQRAFGHHPSHLSEQVVHPIAAQLSGMHSLFQTAAKGVENSGDGKTFPKKIHPQNIFGPLQAVTSLRGHGQSLFLMPPKVDLEGAL